MRRHRTRYDRLQNLVSPVVRFVWGLVLIGCLVFSGDWIPRGLLMALGFVLALCSGKRVSLPYFSFLIATVVLFHLFLPLGKVWFHIASWPFTEGAFLLGLGKGFTFAGLVFLSLGAIHRRLELPGTLGRVWAQTFSWYEQLMEQRSAIKPRALLLSLDRLLERLYPTKTISVTAAETSTSISSDEQKIGVSRTTTAGWFLVATTTTGALLIAVFVR